MHDIIVLYSRPDDPQQFDAHYRNTHIGLVEKLPSLQEFCWGHAVDGTEDCYVVARMTYVDADAAAESMASPQGRAAVADLENFAGAGVKILQVRRDDAR
ncbi:EthD family reductase [Mycobacterium palustre]|nr:EthD family reductase [Mycobacterium palustre]MCV7103530.1 EthD family reductase [Mycobacterium palustre]